MAVLVEDPLVPNEGTGVCGDDTSAGMPSTIAASLHTCLGKPQSNMSYRATGLQVAVSHPAPGVLRYETVAPGVRLVVFFF